MFTSAAPAHVNRPLWWLGWSCCFWLIIGVYMSSVHYGGWLGWSCWLMIGVGSVTLFLVTLVDNRGRDSISPPWLVGHVRLG